jgi:hypothetical protein
MAGHQDDSDDLSPALTGATKLHIAPIFRVNPLDAAIHGTSEDMVDQGTMTFVTYKGHCFGLTNQHVVGDFQRVPPQSAFMLALDRHRPLPGRLIFVSDASNIDFPHDIAVFILHEPTIRSGGKAPIPLVHPQNPVVEGETYLALGYPGHVRGRAGDHTVHPIYHIVTTCISASDRKLVFHDELAPSQDVMRFGGISGGAIMTSDTDDNYSLAGIVFEGRGQHEDVEQRSSDTDIWVYGVPVSATWMDQILADVEAREVPLDVEPLKIEFTVNTIV